MMRYAVSRARPTQGGMLTSVVVHSLLLLLLGLALRQGPSLPIPMDKLTKITYVEAHQGENIAEKIRVKTMAKRHPTLADGTGISTRSAMKRKTVAQPGHLPKLRTAERKNVAEIKTPMPAPARMQHKEVVSTRQLYAKSKDLAQVAIDTPDARHNDRVEDVSSAAPRLKAKAAPRNLENTAHSLESRRTEFDLAGGDIDPAPRSSAGSVERLAETKGAGLGTATLRSSRGGGEYRSPSAGLAPTHRQGDTIADVGADDIVGDGGGGGTADKGGRRTILDYGSGSGGGLRGRSGGAVAPDRSAIEPVQRNKEDPQKQLADTKTTELDGKGMNMSITGQISGRKVLHVVAPKYSRLAKKKGWEGVVAVHFTVLPDGRVKDNLYLEQTSAHRDLNQAAMTAIRQFKFAPLSGDESQVEQWGLITFVFRLH